MANKTDGYIYDCDNFISPSRVVAKTTALEAMASLVEQGHDIDTLHLYQVVEIPVVLKAQVQTKEM